MTSPPSHLAPRVPWSTVLIAARAWIENCCQPTLMRSTRSSLLVVALAVAASLSGCGESSDEPTVALEGRGIAYWDGTKFLGYEFHVYIEPRSDVATLTRVAITSDGFRGEVQGDCAVRTGEGRPSDYGRQESRAATEIYFHAGPGRGSDQSTIDTLTASGGDGCVFSLPTPMPKGGLGNDGVTFRLEGRLADGRRWSAEIASNAGDAPVR